MSQDMMHGMVEKNGDRMVHARMMEMATMTGNMSQTMKEMAGQMSHGHERRAD